MDAVDLSTARWRKSSRSTDGPNCVEVAYLDCDWRKSSRSSDQANCIEVAHVDGAWRKSSRSTDNANCVEVSQGGNAVAVRDSKNVSGPVLTLSVSGWTALLSTMER